MVILCSSACRSVCLIVSPICFSRLETITGFTPWAQLRVTGEGPSLTFTKNAAKGDFPVGGPSPATWNWPLGWCDFPSAPPLVTLSVSLSVCLYLSVFLSLCLSVSLSISFFLSVYMSVCPPFCLYYSGLEHVHAQNHYVSILQVENVNRTVDLDGLMLTFTLFWRSNDRLWQNKQFLSVAQDFEVVNASGKYDHNTDLHTFTLNFKFANPRPVKSPAGKAFLAGWPDSKSLGLLSEIAK